jgi:hypothetical protein
MTNDCSHIGATSRQTDRAALQQQKELSTEKNSKADDYCNGSSTTGGTERKLSVDYHENHHPQPSCTEENKVPLEPAEGNSLSVESITELPIVSDSSSSTLLRKRDSSSNLKNMGEEVTGVVHVPLALMMNYHHDTTTSKEGSTHSNTSTTLSESENSGESQGKKSRSSSPERWMNGTTNTDHRSYHKSSSSTSLSSSSSSSSGTGGYHGNPAVSDSSITSPQLQQPSEPPLTLAAIRKADVKAATIRRSPSSPLLILPSPDSGNDMDPDEFLLQLITALYPNVQLKVKSALTLESYFPTIREEQMAGYNTEIVQIARSNDITALREYYTKHGRDALNCYNRFGEGLLNMACRRGFTEMVQFLLSPDIQLQVRVRDDGGRTPLHDACWYPEPQLDVCTMIIQQDPSLLLVADKRGYTPFQYARKSDWLIWRKFLVQNLDQLRILGTNPDIITRFS